MGGRFFLNKDFIKEFKFILIRSVFIDISVYLISVFFMGFTLSMALGLALGTAVLAVNLIILWHSIRNCLDFKGGPKMRSVKAFSFYVLRLLIFGAAAVASFRLELFSSVGTILPVFYPKLIYVSSSIFKKGGEK